MFKKTVKKDWQDIGKELALNIGIAGLVCAISLTSRAIALALDLKDKWHDFKINCKCTYYRKRWENKNSRSFPLKFNKSEIDEMANSPL